MVVFPRSEGLRLSVQLRMEKMLPSPDSGAEQVPSGSTLSIVPSP